MLLNRCGHCKTLKPAWDKLMHEYREHPDIVIGDCDCTGACKGLCEEMGCCFRAILMPFKTLTFE